MVGKQVAGEAMADESAIKKGAADKAEADVVELIAKADEQVAHETVAELGEAMDVAVDQAKAEEVIDQ
ncbi:unnamed protein product [Prunus armeniaca]